MAGVAKKHNPHFHFLRRELSRQKRLFEEDDGDVGGQISASASFLDSNPDKEKRGRSFSNLMASKNKREYTGEFV